MKTRRYLHSLLAVAVLLPLAFWAFQTIRFQTELLPLLPRDLPSVQGMELYQNAFRSAQEAIVVLEQPTPEQVAAVRAQLSKSPMVGAVNVLGAGSWETMLKSVAWLLVNLPPDQFATLEQRLTPAAMDARLANVQTELAGAITAESVAKTRLDPLGLLDLVGSGIPMPTGVNGPRLVAVTARAKEPLMRFEECEAFIAEVRAATVAAVGDGDLELREAEGGAPRGRLQFSITGRPAFVAENSSMMRRDMFLMLGVALTLAGLAFWVFYRSLRALLWILLLQVVAVLAGVVAARLFFGELNVLSIGFAAILLGVGMDYCILVYHFHASGKTAASAPSQWRSLRRAIWLSSLTTAASFGILYFSSFPGLQQLAVLIATGLLATAFFATELEPLFLERKMPTQPVWVMAGSNALAALITNHRRKILATASLGLVAVLVAIPVWKRYGFYDADLRKLRPVGSEAYRGLDLLMQQRETAEVLEVVVRGDSAETLRARAAHVARAVGTTARLLPDEEFIAANRAQWTPGRAAEIRAAFDRAGFDEEWAQPTALLVQALDAWRTGTEDFAEARAFLSNTASLPGGERLALLRLPVSGAARAAWEKVVAAEPSSLPAHWPTMTEDLGRQARGDFRQLSLWMLGAVVVLCWIAHRSAWLVGLNLAGLVISIAGLFVLLWATGASMTLLSLLSIPLLVGMIIDISLHLVLALEEHQGDIRATFQHMAAPVCLTGLTSMIGFGAPMLTRLPALQNFGLVMDLGILSAVVTGLVLLPAIYFTAHRRPGFSQTLYRAFWFDVGETLARVLGRRRARALGRWAGEGYRWLHPASEQAVRQNLGLLLPGDAVAGPARRVFGNFGMTMADYFLMRSLPRTGPASLIEERVGMEEFYRVANAGKGCVVVTAHLSLFELGSLLFEEVQHEVVVLSLPEPDAALGRWRAAYRRSWSAETLEVGEDPFRFLEITRLLGKGKFVALLADRPQSANCVWVDFPQGKVPFSTGPAWLSLLSGSPILCCTAELLESGRYRLISHPPIYTRWLPEGREASVTHFTQALAAQLREDICRKPDQWFQFVPLSR